MEDCALNETLRITHTWTNNSWESDRKAKSYDSSWLHLVLFDNVSETSLQCLISFAKVGKLASKEHMMPNLSRYLTISEAARKLGVSASTLRNWDRTGKLKARRHPVNAYRLYLREDLEKLLDQANQKDT